MESFFLYDEAMVQFMSATKKHLSNEIEFKIHEKVVNDIEKGIRDQGVWGKALADAYGDAQKAKGIYIKLMVQRLKDQSTAEAEAIEYEKEIARERSEQKRRRFGVVLLCLIALYMYFNILIELNS